MGTSEATSKPEPQVSSSNLTYDVFVNDPPPQDGHSEWRAEAVLSQASTLIYGSKDAVLTNPG